MRALRYASTSSQEMFELSSNAQYTQFVEWESSGVDYQWTGMGSTSVSNVWTSRRCSYCALKQQPDAVRCDGCGAPQ